MRRVWFDLRNCIFSKRLLTFFGSYMATLAGVLDANHLCNIIHKFC